MSKTINREMGELEVKSYREERKEIIHPAYVDKKVIKEKWGVVVGRFCPIHNAHIKVIEKALEENSKVLILVGSSDKINKRNPIPAGLRKYLVRISLKDYESRTKVDSIPDLSNESDNSEEWGKYLYHSIISRMEDGSKEFSLYYGDSVETPRLWFGEDLMKNINIVNIDRGTVCDGLSSTYVRDMIANMNEENIYNSVPKRVFEYRMLIKKCIIQNGGE